MSLLHHLDIEDSKYTSILLLEEKNLLFVGNQVGEVEVWFLPTMDRRAILRYATIDEYGDPLPIEEPVVNLASPFDDNLVYAFFGTAAYCISVDLLTITEKVPISEEVVSGNIGQYTGYIGVITETGYLSRWSPEFVERVASLDFPFEIGRCHLITDYDEERIILIFKDGRLLLSNLGDDPYTVEFQYNEAIPLLYHQQYEINDKFQVLLSKEGQVTIYDTTHDLSIPKILADGRKAADDKVRDFIASQDIAESDKQYITDFRLLRQSRDRYVAEVDHLQKQNSRKPTLSKQSDGKTIMFAISELDTDNIDKKTTAMSVIDKVSARHEINPRYVYFAYRTGATAETIIERTRYYEFEAVRRNTRLVRLRIIALLYSLLLLILGDLVIFTTDTVYFFLALELIGLVIFIYWSNINKNPRIPSVVSYKGLQYLMLICLLGAAVLVTLNSFLPYLQL